MGIEIIQQTMQDNLVVMYILHTKSGLQKLDILGFFGQLLISM